LRTIGPPSLRACGEAPVRQKYPPADRGYRATALVALLADELAPRDPAIAKGIATRARGRIRLSNTDDGLRSLYAAVTCRLLANAKAEKVKLEQQTIDNLSGALRDRKVECEPAKPAAPH
jgi:hypothetical protein